MSYLQPGSLAPSFRSEAVKNGEIVNFSLDDALNGYKYLLLVFYPADFTFVCPTEIVQFVEKFNEFNSQQCSVVCCSTDSAYTHLAWLKADKSERGLGNPDRRSIILLSDRTHDIAEAYGVLSDTSGSAYRATFLIGSDKRVCQVTVNDMPVGRSVDDALRMLRELREGAGGGGGVGIDGSDAGPRIGRSTSAGGGVSGGGRCSKTRMPESLPQPLPPPLMQRQPYQQLYHQQSCQSQYQHQQSCQSYPAGGGYHGGFESSQAGAANGVMASPGGVTYQCEPQSFIVGQPVCSGLAVEAASLETQAAQLRVKDSEDRLAWMLAETDRLRGEAERLRSDTDRLKAEARRRQSEAERLISCHTACQSAGGVGSGVGVSYGATRSNVGDEYSWSTATVGVGARLSVPMAPAQPQQQSYYSSSAAPPTQQPPLAQSFQHQQQLQPRRGQSHVCRRGGNAVASHVAGAGSGRC